MELFASDSLAWFMPKYQRSLPVHEQKEKQKYKLFVAKAQEEEQIFERVSDILSRLDVVIRSEKQLQLPPQNQTQSRLLSQLPLDLIYSIAEKLTLFDYWSFRATCKMFQAAICPKPEFPLFIYLVDNINGLYGIKHPHQNNSCSTSLSNHHGYHDYIIASTMNGWLIMMSYDQRALRFVNLFTGMGVYITPYHQYNDEVRCFKCVGFSKHPTSFDGVTVGYCCGPNERDSIAYLCSRYDSRWKHCDLSHTFSEYPISVVHHQEAFYFMDRLGYLGVFTLVDEEAQWRFCGKQVDINERCFQVVTSHIVECNGDLLSVFFGEQSGGKTASTRVDMFGTEIKVLSCNNVGIKLFRCNTSAKKWEQVTSLGKYSLFIGPNSFSAVPREPKMRNRIYLPLMKDKNMVYYSLETTMFYLLDGEKERPFDKLTFTMTSPSLWQRCWV